MSSMIPEFFYTPALKPLWMEAHRRLSAGSSVTKIHLKNLTDEQRHALAELFASARLPNVNTQIHLTKLREAITPSELEDVLTQVVGPVGNARRDKQELHAGRQDLWEWFTSLPLMQQRPRLLDWAIESRSDLTSGRPENIKPLLNDVSQVLSALPTTSTPLPILAQQCLDDPHALDDGRLPNLVLRALSYEAGIPGPVDSEQSRRIWEQYGVIRDNLSSTVLMAGFAPVGDTFLAQALRAAANVGEPVNATLGQIKRGPREFTSVGTLVSVVENPSIMQAALDRFGPNVPPLICVSGRLHIAARMLVKCLIQSGAIVRYHGDFDVTGVSIAADVINNLGAQPWRMGAADYRSASVKGSKFVAGTVPPTDWDPQLSEAMRQEQRTVYEEAVVETLLEDLDNSRG